MKNMIFNKTELALVAKDRILKLYNPDLNFALNNNIAFYLKNPNLFYQRLAGFIDGEGNFQINPLKGKNGKIVKFSFIFNINIHIDDIDVLNTIAKILGIGLVTHSDSANLNKNICSYRINKESELFKLIQILKNSPGVKYLDFLDFAKAYDLYFNKSSKAITEDLTKELLKLKTE